MVNNLNPDVCDNGSTNPSGFDFKTIPKLGPNLEGLGADITDYLCNVLKISQREDLDPLLRAGAEYNNDVWIKALTGMKDVGDPRFSMGELMTIGLAKYLKPLEIQLKILQEGCQVTNGVLCDADGKEMPFYGKCEQPNLEMFTYENLSAFVVDAWNEAIETHADNFVSYLENNYLSKNWDIELYTLGDDNLETLRTGDAIPLFYVKLSRNVKDENPVYYKYYFDKRNYISNSLGKSLNILPISQFQKDLLKFPDLMGTISGPYWPEKRKKDIFLSGEKVLFKPDKIYVDVSYVVQGGGGTEIFITNDKWNGELPRKISTVTTDITYPESMHLASIKPGPQYISISPLDNGSFSVLLEDTGEWQEWNNNRENKRPMYKIDITYLADKNAFAKIKNNIKIASFERSYRGGSQSAISPVKMGYTKGYKDINTTTIDKNRLTCCVINNVWSLFV